MTKNSLSGTDIFGIAASSICAIHCIATPIAMALLPVYAGEAWESPLAHQLCAGAVAVFCLVAAVQGYRKHADWIVLTPLAVGLLLVVTATFLLPEALHELYETPVLCMGSFALVIGHIWKFTDCRSVVQCAFRRKFWLRRSVQRASEYSRCFDRAGAAWTVLFM